MKTLKKISSTFFAVSVSVLFFAYGMAKMIQDTFQESPLITMNMNSRIIYMVVHYGVFIAFGFFALSCFNGEEDEKGVCDTSVACLAVIVIYFAILILFGR